MTKGATTLPTQAPAKNEGRGVPEWLDGSFLAAAALLAAHTVVVLGMLAFASCDPNLRAVQLGLHWLYPFDCLGISLVLTDVGWFPEDDIISFVTMFGFVGGLQWFVLGFIGALGWHWAIRIRDTHCAELVVPIVCLNLLGAVLATLGIERLRLLEYPPFLDGLYTIAPLFHWPPLALILFWSNAVGFAVLLGQCIVAPLLVSRFHAQLRVLVWIWIPTLILTLTPAIFGLWIWLHAHINTAGWIR